jgi:hypothetical protein
VLASIPAGNSPEIFYIPGFEHDALSSVDETASIVFLVKKG